MSGKGNRVDARALLLLAVILILATGLRFITFVHHQKVDYDEGRYLDTAVHLTEGNGFATSTLSHFIGDPPVPPRPEDFSSPLYPWILSVIFRVTGPSFGAAKALGMLLSVAGVALTFCLGRAAFGTGAGLAAAAAMAVQADQAIVGSWAMTESLYTLLLLCLLIPLVRALREDSPPIRARAAIGFGLALGLLFLCRQNGAALAVAAAALFVLLPPSAGEGRGRRVALVLLMALVTFLVSLPWFVRNLSAFGSPTFTRQSNVSWAEHGRSLYTLEEEPPSFERYREEHGMEGVVASLTRRATRVTRAALLGERGPFRWLTILGFLALLLGPLRRRALILIVPSILSMLLLLGVAPWSGALPRYMMPLRPALYVAGAAVAFALWRWIGERWIPESRRLAAGGALLAVLVGWAALAEQSVYAGYLDRDQLAAHRLARETSEWIAESTPAGSVLLEGGLIHQYAYLHRRPVVWVPWGDFGQTREIAERYGARYLVVSRHVLRFRPGLARHWETEGEALMEKELPAGLQRALDLSSRGLIIYRISTERSQ